MDAHLYHQCLGSFLLILMTFVRDNIVAPAWEMVRKTHLLKKFYIFPSIISTTVLSCIILYQITYTYIVVFKQQDEFFGWLLNAIHSDYLIPTLIFAITFFLGYLLLATLFEG